MKKRILSTLLALCMVLALLPGTAWAAEIASGSCGKSASWRLDSDGTLTVSGSGGMYDYYEKAAPWYSHRAEIETVNINGVSYIGNYSFVDFVNLTEVNIGNTVTVIGWGAFQGCVSLADLIIPGSVSELKSYAFSNCSSLRNLTIKSGLNTIGERAFYKCGSLTNVTLPVGVTGVGDRAFQECISLKTVSIPVGVTWIGREAFANCASLIGVSFPLTVTYIGQSAFYGCSSMSSLTIPSNVLTVDSHAFQLCTGLTRLTIQDGVKSIGYQAFAQCSKLTSLTIPEATLGDQVFKECTGLTSVVFKEGSTKISWWMFDTCKRLKSVTIPSSVTVIDSGAFGNCDALEDVYYTGTEAQWNKIDIRGYTATDYNKKLFLATKHYNSSGDDDGNGDDVSLAKPTVKVSPSKTVTEGTTVTATWNDIPGATNYKLDLWNTDTDDPDMPQIISVHMSGATIDTAPTPKYVIEKKLAPGHYRIDVYASDRNGNESEAGSATFTVTKKAAAKTYTIKLDANSGKVTPSSIKVESGKTYFDELPTPTRNGWKFAGWYTQKTGGSKITSTTKATANRTIYAHWTRGKTFLVTFDANGGMVDQDVKTVRTSNLYGGLPTPTKNNSHFRGWYTKKTGGTKVTETTRANLTANQTLYARWQTSASVRSTQRGAYRVTIPAYYELALYATSSTARISNQVDMTGCQTITCTQKATLSNGTVRYYGKVNGKTGWFTYSCEMSTK